jgi:cellulose synthase/poly-beta-1,6-N-acetylglucosamine synthase-like glycosyltransferase
LDVSIGICAYNEENNIGNLLKNLCKQFVPEPFKIMEIIVVSSGSTDRTDEIVQKLAEKDARIKLISEKERKGKAHALNLLLRKAKGEILVVVSADTEPKKGSVAKLLESMKDDVGGVCAKTIPHYKKPTVLGVFYNFLWRVHNRMLFKEMINGNLGHLGGDMWAIRRGIVAKIPSNIINDDAFIGITLRKKGWKVIFVPKAEVFIKSPRTPLEYISQRERVLIGHKQIEKTVGVVPTTIGAMALKKPYYSTKILVEELKLQKINDYAKILVGIFLEAISNILALINLRRMESYLVWKQIRSTKI